MLSRLLPCLLLCCAFWAKAQDSQNTPMRVIHCSAVDQNAPVHNIYVDANNAKYTAAGEELYQVYSADNATLVSLEEEDWSLLRQTDGNHGFTTTKNAIKAIVQGEVDPEIPLDPTLISVAHYDAQNDQLWIGTAGQGLYQIQVNNDQLQLLEHLTADNSKLKSNQINAILIDRYGRRWVGTDQGVLFGENDSWKKLYEKRDKIVAITALGPDVWILGEGILWRVDDRKRWIPGDVDPKLFQGSVKDIQYDSEGRLWVASEVITRYDVVTDKVEVFGRGQGFTSQDVTCIRIDQEDALWVGTQDKGLFLIEQEAVMTVSCEVEKGKSCEEGTQDAALNVKVFGGQAPYQYRWSSGHTDANPRNLGPGLYTVTVSDAAGQIRQAEAKIEGARLRATVRLNKAASAAEMADGIAKVTVRGGSPAYRYAWDSGEKEATATQLGAGQHEVSITDRFGCTTTATITIPQEVVPEPAPEPKVPVVSAEPANGNNNSATSPSPPPVPEEVVAPLELSLTQNGSLRCADDRNIDIKAIAEGGKRPYTYQWNSNKLRGAHLKQLGAGTYELTITDALGTQQSASLSIAAIPPLQLTITEEDPATNDRSRDGRASVKVSGGAGSYVILWDNGETNITAKKLNPGKRSVQVSDANGCETRASVRINKKIIPELNAATLRRGQTIRMKQLFFAADSTVISNTSVPVLNELKDFLKENPNISIEIGGHTNDVPAHEYCDRLSTARAKSVVDYLVKQGVEENRLRFKGYGKRKPLVSNRTAEGRRKNQRVEIKILKLGG
ncbi:MAG: OmpA family protein [Bacteroidota bacterium]